MARKSSYTTEQKAEALRIYVERGTAAAARETGIPQGTIGVWAFRNGLKSISSERMRDAIEAAKLTNEQLRSKLRTMLLEKAIDALERTDQQHIEYKGNTARQVTYDRAPHNAYRDYSISAAILLDKYRLEVGEATARSETRALTDGLGDTEKQRLRDWIDSLDTAEPAADRVPEADPV